MSSYTAIVEGCTVTVKVWEESRKYNASVDCPNFHCRKERPFVAFRRPSAKKAKAAVVTALEAHMKRAHKQ